MTTSQTATPYLLLPPGDDWRQALVLPTKGSSEGGISLDGRASRHLVWLELLSGTVWGILFSGAEPFLSFHHLAIVAQRLEGTHADDASRVIHHFAPLFGWRNCSAAGPFECDLATIAEEIVLEEITRCPGWDQEYQPSPDSVRKLSRPYLSLFMQGWQAFNAALDKETLGLLHASFGEAPSFSAYNYLRHPLEKICRNRRQALHAYPLLGRILVSVGRGHEAVRLQQVIDAGHPLAVAVADYFRCPKRLARFLAGKGFAEIGEEWRHDLRQLVEMLVLIKPDRWPENAGDWREFNRWLRPAFGAWQESRQRMPPQVMRNAFNELARGGYGNIARKLEIHGVEFTDLLTITDFIRNFCEWAEQSGGTVEEAELALSHYSVLRLTLLSRRWHAWQARLLHGHDPCEEVDGDGPEWLTLIDRPWEYHGHAVVPLDTAWKLQDEGQRMEHCVGSYRASCLYRGSHIFSIRDMESGRSLSTAELSIEDGKGAETAPIEICQHYGPKNSVPSEACQGTLEAFLLHLRQEPDPERLKEIRVQLYERSKSAMRAYGESGAPAWPRRRIEEFSELLRGFPTLAGIGAAAGPRP